MAMADPKAPAKPVPTGTELMLHYHDTGEFEAEVKAFLARGYTETPFIVNPTPPNPTGYTVGIAHAYRLRRGKVSVAEIDLAERAANLRGMDVDEYRKLARKAAAQLAGAADAGTAADEEADL